MSPARTTSPGAFSHSAKTPSSTDQHNNDQLPVILLGGAGGKLQGGRVLDYTSKPDRQLCRLFLSLMVKADVRLKTFGDATSRLDEV